MDLQVLHDAYQNTPAGLDAHSYAAGLVFGVPYDETTPEQRAYVKHISFGMRFSDVAVEDDSIEKLDREITELYDTRAAMKRAGVPNWQLGKGVSAADAIDYLARERNTWRFTCAIMSVVCVLCVTAVVVVALYSA